MCILSATSEAPLQTFSAGRSEPATKSQSEQAEEHRVLMLGCPWRPCAGWEHCLGSWALHQCFRNLISLGKNIFSKETKSEKTRGLQSYAPKRSVLWKKENVETSFYNGTFVALKWLVKALTHSVTAWVPLLLEYYLFSTQKTKNEDGRPFLANLLHQGQLLPVLMQWPVLHFFILSLYLPFSLGLPCELHPLQLLPFEAACPQLLLSLTN